MATSEAEILDQYRIALHNARHQSAISQILDEFGYGPDTLAEGDARLAAARSAFDGNRTERSEASAAHHVFSTKKDQLIDRYALDGCRVKSAFCYYPATANERATVGNTPGSYFWEQEAARTFYSVSLANTEIHGKFARLKSTPENLSQANTFLGEVETARANYF